MMEVHCDIIRDLLPLYMEDMASIESARLIEVHLSSCPACRKELSNMQSVRVIPLQTDTRALCHVKTSIIKRRLFTAFTAVMVALSLFLGGHQFMDATIYVPAEAAIERVEQASDGSIYIYTNPHVNASTSGGDTDGGHWGFLASMRMKTYLFPDNAAQEQPGAIHAFRGIQPGELSDMHLWYMNIGDGTAEAPLWGTEGTEPPSGAILTPSYFLFCYCGAALLLSLLLAILSKRTAGNRRAAAQTLCALCLSLCVGAVLTCGGQLVSYSDPVDTAILHSLIVAVPMAIAMLCTLKLRAWKQKDAIL